MSLKQKGKTLADFRAIHDRNVVVPTKIRAALAAMEAEGGPENWDYEQAFIKRAGISVTDLGAFRDQFAAHIVETSRTGSASHSKRVWVASAKAAAKFHGE
jgi:hypothetical protein